MELIGFLVSFVCVCISPLGVGIVARWTFNQDFGSVLIGQFAAGNGTFVNFPRMTPSGCRVFRSTPSP